MSRRDSLLWTGSQAQAIDRASCALHPQAGENLMEEAARALFHKILCTRQPFQKLLVLAGLGNNGGDALALARLLAEAGFPLTIISVGEGRESPLRHLQRERCEALGLTLHPFSGSLNSFGFDSHTYIVDGVCGLGLKEDLRPGPLLNALLAARAIGARTVLAIDLPSGLPADDWSARELPLPATLTLSFGAAKPAHLLAPGRLGCGSVESVNLSFDPAAITASLGSGPRIAVSDDGGEDAWNKLDATAHKYTRGHALALGGSKGKVGAIYLAAEAAVRSGVGWVSVEALSSELAPPRPSFLTYEEGLLASAERLESFLRERRVKAVLIGPGCLKSPLSDAVLELLGRWNRDHELALVFDAGALHDPRLEHIAWVPERTLLTPHPGEWLALRPGQVPLDSLSALDEAWNFCRRAGVSVFYKSSTPFTLAWVQDRPHLTVSRQGDARLAKAGSGDVLAGTALALLCAGVPAFLAGHQAQNRVAQAARRATKEGGFHGLSANDIVAQVR